VDRPFLVRISLHGIIHHRWQCLAWQMLKSSGDLDRRDDWRHWWKRSLTEQRRFGRLLGKLRYSPAAHLLGHVGQSLHYIFPSIIAGVANKSSGYELVNDLAGGHSVPEAGYDRFANGRLEGLRLIVDFDPHTATRAAKADAWHYASRQEFWHSSALIYQNFSATGAGQAIY
jgi:hypothetical protein